MEGERRLFECAGAIAQLVEFLACRKPWDRWQGCGGIQHGGMCSVVVGGETEKETDRGERERQTETKGQRETERMRSRERDTERDRDRDRHLQK